MFQSFATSYEDDFPNPIALHAELDLWEKYGGILGGREKFCHRI